MFYFQIIFKRTSIDMWKHNIIKVQSNKVKSMIKEREISYNIVICLKVKFVRELEKGKYIATYFSFFEH